MRRHTLFWAVILILAGILLLLGNAGILQVNVWGLVWPLFLVALGVWLLGGVFFGQPLVETEEVVIPLEGAPKARVQVKHGAGRLRVGGGAGPGELVSGTFGGGLDHRERRSEDLVDLDMRVPAGAFRPWMWGPERTLDWSFRISDEIPLALEFDTGAGEARLDLTGLRVTDLRLETGASSTDLTLPARAGNTRVRINAGAASVTVRVPAGVAARVRASAGLASVRVDGNLFPRQGDVFQSPDYDTAPNKVDIDIGAGVGSIDVRGG